MKHVLLVAVLAGAPSWAAAQDVTLPPQQTTSTNGRFEIVQSPLTARWTFRLDRFAGWVAQLVRTTGDENAWEDMEVIGLPAAAAASKPRFQIFTSGLAARHTFLMDTTTGHTWCLVTGKRRSYGGKEYEVSVWQPSAE